MQIEDGRVGDRDLDRGLELAAQLDELLEEEDGDDGLGGDDGLDGGRVDGVLSYAEGLDGGEGSTLAVKTTMARRRRLQKAILEELLGGFLSRVFNSFKSQTKLSFSGLGMTDC